MSHTFIFHKSRHQQFLHQYQVHLVYPKKITFFHIEENIALLDFPFLFLSDSFPLGVPQPFQRTKPLQPSPRLSPPPAASRPPQAPHSTDLRFVCIFSPLPLPRQSLHPVLSSFAFTSPLHLLLHSHSHQLFPPALSFPRAYFPFLYPSSANPCSPALYDSFFFSPLYLSLFPISNTNTPTLSITLPSSSCI